MIKVKADERTLDAEAERISYKLRLKPEADEGELSENCPAYVPFNSSHKTDLL